MDGYDSDGNGPPPGTSDDVEFEEDSNVPIDRPQEAATVMEDDDGVDRTPRHIPIAAEEVEKMTVAALKHELTIRGVQFKSTGMLKSDFVKRLNDALAAELKVTTFMDPAALKDFLKNTKKEHHDKVDDLSGFIPGSY